MPFDPNALFQGVQAGRETPNRNSGLADMIRTITKDLRTAKATRMENQSKVRDQNINILKAYLDAGYYPKQGSNLQSAVETGDFSGFNRESLADQLGAMFGGGAAGGGEGAQGMLGGGANIPVGTTMKAGPFTIPLNPKMSVEESRMLQYAEGMLGDVQELKGLLGTKNEIIGNIPGGLWMEGPQRFALARDRLADALLRLRSGAQINEQEYRRLRNLLPTAMRRYDVDMDNLLKFEREFAAIAQRLAYGRGAVAPMTGTPSTGGGGAEMLGGTWIRMIDPQGNEQEVRGDSVREALQSGWNYAQ